MDAAIQWLNENYVVLALLKIAIVFFVVLTVVAYMSLAERKVLGWMQMAPYT